MMIRASFVATASAVLTMLIAGTAQAGAPNDYWLEARPYTCSTHLPALAREITLACDAAGGACAIARSEGSAKRRLLFHCAAGGGSDAAEPAWTVEGTDEHGVRLWTADLAGNVDDRMRAAALWVVRAEGIDAAPTSAPAPAPAFVPKHAASERTEKDSAPDETTESRGATFAVAGRTSLGFTRSAEAGAAVGFSALVGGRLIPELVIGLAGGMDRILAVHDYRLHAVQATSGHVGAILALGAPFDVKAYGIQVEGGPGATSTALGLRAYWYVRGALTAQLSAARPSRPWAALSFTQATEDAGPLQRIVSLDLGFAWSP